MVRLLLFAGTQSPLPVRYPHPDKPRLALPPLVHRSLHTALDAAPPSALFADGLLSIPQPGSLHKHARDADHDATVKVQVYAGGEYLPAIEEALGTLARVKGLSEVETGLVGLPAGTGAEEWNAVWESLGGIRGATVAKWGTIGLDADQLSKLSSTPAVNELNVTDCATLPKEYTAFAKEKGIQLWASGGGAGPEPLPSADLHNLLSEFQPKLAALAPGARTAPLAQLVAVTPEGTYEAAAPGVRVRWVVSYTLVSRSRNIVKDKGYIVAADFA
ncbi:hypothetical protein CC85DRAFT_325376 [Cutaneotrichosporon oleaginosum]|uniref:Gamma-glutamylcysteine synthetase regulatory subunit n=1 Tax=Cutaneotrichosporon oleaginosum TaxID=879819 RepID=A0A0J1BC97_9TREE|nr:uncharacterized protein CC85DRAFT_325376 [Cutaneotrichosporon oleaginosum]KLT45649.1 hypothetical protein CC85DRAFT_325376 [Cutaneotrichosporon oleaginosum]TXT04558.1 hypothetical protein COLE_07377 [Cutaneotrichosporon oleaginosum]